MLKTKSNSSTFQKSDVWYFLKGLASYAYERLAKKRLDEERDC